MEKTKEDNVFIDLVMRRIVEAGPPIPTSTYSCFPLFAPIVSMVPLFRGLGQTHGQKVYCKCS